MASLHSNPLNITWSLVLALVLLFLDPGHAILLQMTVRRSNNPTDSGDSLDLSFSFPTSLPMDARLEKAREFAEINSLFNGFGCAASYECVARKIVESAAPVILESSIQFPERKLERRHGEKNSQILGGAPIVQHTYVGKGSYLGGRYSISQFGKGAALRIGRYCSIAEMVHFYTGGDHHIEHISSYPWGNFYDRLPSEANPWDGDNPDHTAASSELISKGDIVVGSDVWVGFDALILSGVTIGNGAVVAARSVVTKDVPPYAIVAGNPARIKRYRFDPDTVARLEATAWWDWDDWDLAEALGWLQSDNFEAFFEFADGMRTIEVETEESGEKRSSPRTMRYIVHEGEEEIRWRARAFCGELEGFRSLYEGGVEEGTGYSCDVERVVCEVLETCSAAKV
jgi:acetyltransferase-like isoleucine patch superfamily enzyme